MVQFYFLSILLNLIAGFSLLADSESETSILDGLKTYVLNETFRLVVGILTMAVGLFKILSVFRGDLPVVGDLFPAIAGLATGFSLILDYYRTKTSIVSESSGKLELIFIKNKKWIGYLAILAAVLHFIFPTVLFL